MKQLTEQGKLKIKYTKLLEREKKADDYFNGLNEKLNNPFLSDKEKQKILDDKEKWKPEYEKIIDELSETFNKIFVLTPKNIQFGWPELLEEFKDVKLI